MLFAIRHKYPLSFEKIALYFVRENGHQQQQRCKVILLASNIIGMKTFGHNELIELINSIGSHHELVELNCLVGLIKLFKLSELIVKYPISLIVRIISLVGHNGLVGFIGLVGHNGIVVSIV